MTMPAWQHAIVRALDENTFRTNQTHTRRYMISNDGFPSIHWLEMEEGCDVGLFAAQMRQLYEVIVVHECSARVLDWVWVAFDTLCVSHGHATHSIIVPLIIVDLTGVTDTVMYSESFYSSLLALTCRYDHHAGGGAALKAQVLVVCDRAPIVGHVSMRNMKVYKTSGGTLIANNGYDTVNRLFDNEIGIMEIERFTAVL